MTKSSAIKYPAMCGGVGGLVTATSTIAKTLCSKWTFSITRPVFTVWKFQDFSITQILREINFEESGSAKSAISTHLEAVNFDFYEFLHFSNKNRALIIAKMVVLELLDSSKLISRKI